MRMLVTVEFADAGRKSGSHGILTIGRGLEEMQSGDIGLSLEEAKTLFIAVQEEFIAAQAAQFLETHRQCPHCPKRLKIKDWKLRRVNTALGKAFLPHRVFSPERATASRAAPYHRSKVGSRGQPTN
jgi:hypothetical protein